MMEANEVQAIRGSPFKRTEWQKLHEEDDDVTSSERDEEWGSEQFSCDFRDNPMEPSDLQLDASNHWQKKQTDHLRPRRIAVCHIEAGNHIACADSHECSRLARQISNNSEQMHHRAVLFVKFYEVNDVLGVYCGHCGQSSQQLKLQLDREDWRIVDLCVSNQNQLLYLADSLNACVHVINLKGQLQFTIDASSNSSSRSSAGPQAVAVDDSTQSLVVCYQRSVTLYDLSSGLEKCRISETRFQKIVSAASHNKRLWLVDNSADQLQVWQLPTRKGSSSSFERLNTISIQNPQCVCIDASGCAFVTTGDPLHSIFVYLPNGEPVGSFGGWETGEFELQLPTGAAVYQLSKLVDQRQLAFCCFAECCIRFVRFKNLETSIV